MASHSDAGGGVLILDLHAFCTIYVEVDMTSFCLYHCTKTRVTETIEKKRETTLKTG